MRTVSAAFEAALANVQVRLCELYEIELANGTIYRYTDHAKDITWDAAGNTYTALPLRRGPIRFNTDGRHDECELAIGIRDLAILNTVQTNILEAAQITHKRIRWDASYAADEEIVLGIWVPDVDFDRSNLSLKLKSLLDTLAIHVPAHQYQEPCNHFLFDDNCGLTRADYAYAGTATAGDATSLTDAGAGTVYTAEVVQIVYLTATTGTIWYVELSNANNFESGEVLSSGGDTVTLSEAPAEDTTFYPQGELSMTSGDNDGERRPILSCSGSVRTVLWPFPAAIEAGDTYAIYPGCDFTPQTCHARFNNLTPYDGYPFCPPWEETAM